MSDQITFETTIFHFGVETEVRVCATFLKGTPSSIDQPSTLPEVDELDVHFEGVSQSGVYWKNITDLLSDSSVESLKEEAMNNIKHREEETNV